MSLTSESAVTLQKPYVIDHLPEKAQKLIDDNLNLMSSIRLE